jgi:hypothetical protein
VVPTASALFAFALGTLAGTLTRRTIPAMALDSGLIDRAGHRLTLAQETAMLRAARDADISKLAYLQQHGIRGLEVYQPGDRFWTFQLIEAGLLLALAGVLLAIAVWLVHRRTG